MEYRESTTARRLRNPAEQRPIPFGSGVGRAAAPLDETSSAQSSGSIIQGAHVCEPLTRPKGLKDQHTNSVRMRHTARPTDSRKPLACAQGAMIPDWCEYFDKD